MKTWIVKTRAVVRREYVIAAETAAQAEFEAMLGDVPWDADAELLEAAHAPSREQASA
jgi:hypothetical protein